MLTRRARISFAIVYAAGLLLVSGLCAEWIVRQNGWRPWQHEDPGVTHLPHDPHPNARANRHYADRLATVLR